MKKHLALLLMSPLSVAAVAVRSRASAPPGVVPSRRRAFLSDSAKALVASSVLLVDPGRALAAPVEGEGDDDDEEEVYFGAGCFWHVQHEMTNAERTILGRTADKFTSRTGYAGGTKTDPGGLVCYHNFQGVADYGKLGHGEVVGLRTPTGAIGDFAREYFALFGDKGERADPMDKGGEYSTLRFAQYLFNHIDLLDPLGLPGGRNHPMFEKVEAAATDRGMTLVDGRGNDPDTLGKRLVYVMDSRKFPFYQAEVYHQYHNDFLTPAYGKEYNNLVNAALDDGRIKITGCPDRVSLLGLPGGRNHPMFEKVEAAATDRGMTLVDGRGNDPDTLGKRLVYVMDSRKFPFYQAEVYHQYHNDFLTPAYGKEYNNLVNAALDDGRIKITGCPDRV
ncbi:hypothetical protein ACHAXA_006126 [Cyclostephanos tholiformis]|uniref:Peptide-methionine (S)-S-oxide reductase n=1 Tax=Cyclostephanos tholiformis TaxID=382380 RepID=A0ABD3RHQ0_9STRA